MADLVRAGLETEFVGRIPVRVVCRALHLDDLIEVLRNAEGSVRLGWGIRLRLVDGCATARAQCAWVDSSHSG